MSGDEQPDHALFPIYGGARCVRDDCAAVLSSGSGVGFEAMLAHEAAGCTFRATHDSAFLRIQRDALFDDLRTMTTRAGRCWSVCRTLPAVGERPHCEACGDHHHVRRAESGGLLCKSCEEGTPRNTLDAIYVDLGVSG